LLSALETVEILTPDSRATSLIVAGIRVHKRFQLWLAGAALVNARSPVHGQYSPAKIRSGVESTA
jgi:hypothetical protein